MHRDHQHRLLYTLSRAFSFWITMVTVSYARSDPPRPQSNEFLGEAKINIEYLCINKISDPTSSQPVWFSLAYTVPSSRFIAVLRRKFSISQGATVLWKKTFPENKSIKWLVTSFMVLELFAILSHVLIAAEIVMFEGITCVFKSNIDLIFYVFGSSQENEVSRQIYHHFNSFISRVSTLFFKPLAVTISNSTQYTLRCHKLLDQVSSHQSEKMIIIR